MLLLEGLVLAGKHPSGRSIIYCITYHAKHPSQGYFVQCERYSLQAHQEVVAMLAINNGAAG
ncbi:MAG: hypothetical protein ACSLEM_05280 [Candidatus Malihini olakiniferum]